MTPIRSNTVRQIPERGSTNWAAVQGVLDEGFLAHVAFGVNSQPYVLPMLYARCERSLFLHGAAASRLVCKLSEGIEVCVAVTLVDGLVLARSAFNHSMNYRSVVAFGTARAIEDTSSRVAALRNISDHLLPGRWGDVRGPNKHELAQTTVLEMAIEEASTKIRTGPVSDEPDDHSRATWAGVLPIALRTGVLVPDPHLKLGTPTPDYLQRATHLFSQERTKSP